MYRIYREDTWSITKWALRKSSLAFCGNQLYDVQAILGADGFGLFRRAATDVGVFGFLVAFMAGFFVYGAGLTVFTLAIKWIVIGRVRAGVHRWALPLPCLLPLFPSWHPICHLHQQRMQGS